MTDRELYPVYHTAIKELGLPPMSETEFLYTMAAMSPNAHAHYHCNLIKLVDPALIAHEVEQALIPKEEPV